MKCEYLKCEFKIYQFHIEESIINGNKQKLSGVELPGVLVDFTRVLFLGIFFLKI